MKHKRILIADSCIGGLSILPFVAESANNDGDAELIFLADYAVNPLGTKPPEEIFAVAERWSQLAATQADAMIIACNTLSIRYGQQFDAAKKSVPVTSMLDYTEALIVEHRETLWGANVLILGTAFTAGQPVYKEMIHRLADPATVECFAATNLERRVARLQTGPLLSDPGIESAIDHADVVLLSCTCFPLVKEELSAQFQQTVFLAPGSNSAGTFGKQRLRIAVTGDVIALQSVVEFAQRTLGSSFAIEGLPATDLGLA